MALDVLIVGNGGREHAMAWKIAQSPRAGKIYIAPGNGAISESWDNVSIDSMDIVNLAKFATEKNIGLTIVGPEGPLEAGIVDFFKQRGLRIFGPSKDAARIESSKSFAKTLMEEAHVPTARFNLSQTYDIALANLRRMSAPYVVKASGLASGKGVYICPTIQEAEVALKEIMVDKKFAGAGEEVVIEEFIAGSEISAHALTDGKNFCLFPPSQDYKTIGEGDTGKNTGGMGAIAPLPWISTEIMIGVEQGVVRPTLEALSMRGAPFVGLLYPGLKYPPGGASLKVLEFNSRFGDPEAQVYMRLMRNDLLDVLEAALDGGVSHETVKWNWGFAASVVLASGGYPDAYKENFPIHGIKEAGQIDGVVVFHMGTKHGDTVVTGGGRVLGVSAVASTLEDALKKAYAAADRIDFEGKYLRRDIGKAPVM